MITINLIGTGNVAWHLANQFAKVPECTLLQIAGRSKSKLERFKHLTNNVVSIQELHPAMITIIAVTDDAIHKVATQIPEINTLIVHTSGSIDMNAISQNHKGVFYPLQSFSKNDQVDFTQIPICIEATHKEDLELLHQLAIVISTKIYKIDSQQRKQTHLAAVFINNFTNHCYTIAEALCQKDNIPFELLHGLLEKTAQKAIEHSPSDVQTGPAKRNDTQVIAAHLDMLQEDHHKSIYKVLTTAISTYYGKEL